CAAGIVGDNSVIRGRSVATERNAESDKSVVVVDDGRGTSRTRFKEAQPDGETEKTPRTVVGDGRIAGRAVAYKKRSAAEPVGDVSVASRAVVVEHRQSAEPVGDGGVAGGGGVGTEGHPEIGFAAVAVGDGDGACGVGAEEGGDTDVVVDRSDAGGVGVDDVE